MRQLYRVLHSHGVHGRLLHRNTPELIAIFIAAKSALTFGMGFKILVWIQDQGYLVIGMTFTAVMFFICAFGVFFIVLGKSIRRWTGKWKVSHVHKL